MGIRSLTETADAAETKRAAHIVAITNAIIAARSHNGLSVACGLVTVAHLLAEDFGPVGRTAVAVIMLDAIRGLDVDVSNVLKGWNLH